MVDASQNGADPVLSPAGKLDTPTPEVAVEKERRGGARIGMVVEAEEAASAKFTPAREAAAV